MKMGLGLGLQKRGGGAGASGPAVTALVATATGGTTAQLDITASAGTVYWGVSTSATPPSVAALKAGTGMADSGSYTNPGTFTGPSGLTASTTYYPYALVNDGVSDSEVYAGASFATEATDVTAPSLTSPGATVLDTTSADMTVTTNEGRGTLWAIASTVNSPPSAAQIKLGQDGSGTTTNVAFAAGGGAGVNVGATGVQTITATGLTEVAHYGFFYQEDPTGNGSSVVATGAFTPADVTGPVLSSAEGTVSGSYGGTGAVNTDTGEGLLSSVVTKSSTTPTATQIIAGQDHTGAAVPTGAKDLANTVSASGPQAVAFSDLDGASSYWTHFAQTDEATNQSNAITASASFTTAAVAVPSAMSAPSLAVDSSTQITATLAADPARNGADITSYDLRYSTDEASWTTVTGVTSPHAITGLSAATLYYVQTRAVNSAGAGAWSASASDTTSAASGGITFVGANSNNNVGTNNGSTLDVDLTALSGGSDTSPSENDVAIAFVAVGNQEDRTSQAMISSGWTLIADNYHAGAAAYDTVMSAWYKVMGATPDTVASFEETNSTAYAIAGEVRVYRGVDTTTPLDVTSTLADGEGVTNPNPPSITPTTSGALIVALGAGTHPTSPMATWTTSDLSNFTTDTGADTTDIRIAAGDAAWTSGAFDPAAWGGGFTNANASWAAITIALRPA